MSGILDGLIEGHQLAERLKMSWDFIQRRLSDPDHPQHIPNIKIGRKRFVYEADLRRWLDKLKTS